jgi:lysophospholipase L1-like esterase
MERARAGEDITIGFIGGSITMGTGASFPDKCYAKLVYDWWVENFPDANFTFVNAGIGATTSQFACARVEDDLLSKKPDFVVVEFSVNDESTEKYAETYESLLRTILTSETEPAVLVLNMVQYNNGQNAQNRHNMIATAYDLPIISMKESIYNEILFGNLTAADVSADNLHPNDKGHAYAAEIVTNYLGLVNNKTYEIPTSYEVPETSNKLSSMTSKRYDNRNSSPELNGFTADTTVQNNITEVFRNGYKAKNAGDSITFKVTGSNISLQYMKTNTLGAPYAIAIIDGDEANVIELDGNYPNGWGDWLYLHDIATNLENKEHTVVIRITEAGQKDFYLVSVIASE